jgi:mannose-1-phosphate guanylyltransferase/mannose-6-phosphate isomerase
MSGGAGTRLWPVSRQMHPKPFMLLPEGLSILQKTLERAAAIPEVKKILTITNRDIYFKTRDEYEAMEAAERVELDYLLEPMGRNTAPAIAMAAIRVAATDPDAVMLVMPADHLIDDYDAFAAAVHQAADLAADGKLVTFGIRPDRPETGYGYIQTGNHPNEVRSFVEKPDLATAEQYLEEGDYLWNSGMFCFQASTFLSELEKNAPDVFNACQATWQASNQDDVPLEFDAVSFASVPSISVDYAVMEKSGNVAIVAGDFPWSDIGSWEAFGELVAPDENGNRTDGDVVLVDSENTYIYSDHRLVAAVGVDDMVIIDTPDALLVGHRDKVQDVRRVVDELKQRDDDEIVKLHRTVHRPWGTYTVLEEGPRFKIKRITVKPGASLSLQYHHHRSEHWIVVTGTARVDDGDKEQLVQTNESTYIPAGRPHRLSNPGVTELAIIEVQCGEYLGEDDIVRMEDKYGRAL